MWLKKPTTNKLISDQNNNENICIYSLSFFVKLTLLHSTEKKSRLTVINEPRHEKTSNLIFEEVQHKPNSTNTKDG